LHAMTAESAVLVRAFPVGRWTCTLTFPRPRRGEAMQLAAEWSPSVPSHLTPADLAQYRVGRNAALRDLASIVGEKIMVVDI
jgi:hypothetical protein